jgi:hypothetical protein
LPDDGMNEAEATEWQERLAEAARQAARRRASRGAVRRDLAEHRSRTLSARQAWRAVLRDARVAYDRRHGGGRVKH